MVRAVGFLCFFRVFFAVTPKPLFKVCDHVVSTLSGGHAWEFFN